MIKVNSKLDDDIFGLWRVTEIVVQRDGERYAFVPDGEVFVDKSDALRFAQARARRFLQRQLGVTNGDVVWEPPLETLCNN
ncbi:MAG TPA: hypothetical protein VFS39_07555 [Nitrospira sp.]|nr:hypothetical protein [Nitrospira sp.]